MIVIDVFNYKDIQNSVCEISDEKAKQMLLDIDNGIKLIGAIDTINNTSVSFSSCGSRWVLELSSIYGARVLSDLTTNEVKGYLTGYTKPCKHCCNCVDRFFLKADRYKASSRGSEVGKGYFCKKGCTDFQKYNNQPEDTDNNYDSYMEILKF